ncbi:hypothetical protein NBRC116586_35870 [Pseudooceanicola nitratireducens]|uniref:acyltransferase family protein n=1 Tax=Pseudooceanicola nitratireducens TaxID=517719 RepID=UPI00310A5DB3
MKYRPEIDGLRTIAVLPVILFHAEIAPFHGGYVGVDVFFVISGYLITSLLLGDIAAGQFSIVNFYERRIRRILPALFTVMLATLPFAYIFLLPTEFEAYGKSLIAVPTFVSNVLFWSERGYFGAAADLKPLVHTWSLAVEEQFYIFFPPLLAFLAHRARWLKAGAFGVIFLLSLIASWYLTRLHFETGFYLPVSRIWELLTGAACAVWLRRHAPLSGIGGAALAALGLALILWSVFAFDSSTVFPGVMAAVPVAGTALVILAGLPGNPVAGVLASRPFVFIGLLSYSLYLWHQPIFAFLRHAGHGNEWALLASLPLVFLASWLSYRFIETPVRRNRALTRRQIFGGALAGSLAFIAIGAAIVLSRGAINRYAPEDVALMEQFEQTLSYNEEAFDAAQFRPFDTSDRRKIVIAGDSYARDLYNVLREGGVEDSHQFTTKRINAECGNVFTEQDLSVYISPLRQERCRVMMRLDHPDMQPMLEDADEIWLTGRWNEWVISLLPQTIANLEETYGARVRVFGLKNFGQMNMTQALSIPIEDRPSFRQPAADHIVSIDTSMKEIIPPGYFIKLLDPFCAGDHRACPVFSPDGQIFTIDGGHLTQAGAQHMAPILKGLIGLP